MEAMKNRPHRLQALVFCLFLGSLVCVSTALAQTAIKSILPPHKNIELFYNQFSRDTMYLVDDFYDPDVQFADPIVQLTDREQLRTYYQDMYDNVKDIEFKFDREIVQGDEHIVFWTMTMTTKRLNKGRPIVVEGVSHIRFGGGQGKAVYHRDYFDVGEMVYEHAPIVGRLTRYVKNKLKGEFKDK